MEDDEVERGADYFRIETFRPCGDADIQECVVIFGNAVLENGMGGVQLLQETDESFTGGACRMWHWQKCGCQFSGRNRWLLSGSCTRSRI